MNILQKLRRAIGFSADTTRSRRRKTLLLRSVPVAFVLILLAIKLLSLASLTTLAQTAYKAGDYNKASQRLTPLRFLNGIEPYKYYFNVGTVQLGAAQYATSVNSLTHALQLVPRSDECFVRVNLVDAYIGQADAAVASQKYGTAIMLYAKAKAVVDARDCGLKAAETSATDDTKKADQTLQAQKQEASDKQSAAQKAQAGDPSAVNNAASASQNGAPSQLQQDKLQAQQTKNDEATREDHDNSRQSDASSSYNSGDYQAKSW